MKEEKYLMNNFQLCLFRDSSVQRIPIIMGIRGRYIYVYIGICAHHYKPRKM